MTTARFVLSLIISYCLSLLSACGPAQPDLIITATGSLRGYIEECECGAGASGGLARRVGVLKRLALDHPGVPLLHLDAGHFANWRDPLGAERFTVLRRMYADLNFAAVNLSAYDLGDDAAALLADEDSVDSPFISANLIASETGAPVFPILRSVTRGRLKIAIIGITEEVLRDWRTSAGRIVNDDPFRAMPAQIASARQTHDLVILLAHMQKHELEAAGATLAGVDLIIACDGINVSFELERIGDIPCVYTGARGQYVPLLRYRHNPAEGLGPFELEVVPLAPGVMVDEETMVRIWQVLPPEAETTQTDDSHPDS